MYSLQATPHCPTPLWSLGLVDVWKPHLKDPGSITQELRCPCQSKLLMLAKFMHPVIYRVTRTSLHRNLPPFSPLYFFIRPLCLFSLILFWRSLQISLPAFLSGCDDLKRVFFRMSVKQPELAWLMLWGRLETRGPQWKYLFLECLHYLCEDIIYLVLQICSVRNCYLYCCSFLPQCKPERWEH